VAKVEKNFFFLKKKERQRGKIRNNKGQHNPTSCQDLLPLGGPWLVDWAVGCLLSSLGETNGNQSNQPSPPCEVHRLIATQRL